VKGWLRWSIAFAVALLAHGATADINSWTSIGPNGGRVFRVVYNRSNPSIVYVLSQGGFGRSTDGGGTWKMVNTDLSGAPYDMAADPTNPSNVYVVVPTAPYFMASSDAGKTMTPATRPPFTFNFGGPWSVQVAADGKTVFVAAGTEVAASTDRGKTWTLRAGFPSQAVVRLFADPHDAGTLYAAVDFGPGYGLYVTHDGALTWTASNFSATDQYNYTNDLAIDSSDPNTLWNARANGLWVSHDRGATWALTSYAIPAFGNASRQVSAVAVDPRNSSVIYASNGWGETLRSSDAGISWIDVTGNLTAGGANVIAINPASGAVLIGGLGGLWGSASGGASWTEQVQGLPTTYVEHFSANAAADRIYMNTEDSIIGYVAGGASAISLTNRDALKQLSPAPGSFVVNSILAQEGIGGKLFASLIGGMASSTDGGESWTVQPLSFANGTQIFSMATWPGSQSILFSGGAAQYRSIDNGITWTAITAGLPPDTQFSRLVTAPSDPTVAYTVVYGGLVLGPTPYYDLYKSVDAGLTWQRAGSDWPGQIYQIVVDPFDAQTFYVTTEKRFLKSTTGGKTFTDMPWNSNVQGGQPRLVAVDPVHAQILYAVAGQGIVRSVDGGQTWQVLAASPYSPTYGWSATEITVDPNRTSDVYVGTMRNGAYKLTVASDLAVSVQSSAAQSGSALTSTYKAVNKGPYDTTGAKLVVQLPAGVTNVSGTVDGGQCTNAATLLTCTVPVMRTGKTYSVLVSAVAPAAGNLTSKATLTADQPDSDTSNNSAATTTRLAGTANLSIETHGPASAKTGDSVSYTVTISNAGPDAAVAAHLNYQPDASIKVAGASADSGSCSSTDAGVVSCDLGDIPVSKTVTITVNAVATTAGTSNATATVTSLNIDPAAKNNSASSTSISGAPAQTGSSSSSNGGAVSGGGTASGGGGAFSAPWLLALALMLLAQKAQLLRRGARASVVPNRRRSS